MKKYIFYATDKNGKKTFFGTVKVPIEESSRNYFKRAISLLKRKSKDMAEFLRIQGKHLYFWEDKITWETT